MPQIKTIKMLAELMRERKKHGLRPYVLFLGAGASISSGAAPFRAIVEAVLKRYTSEVVSGTWEEKLGKFYQILGSRSDKERYLMLSEHLEGRRPSDGYFELAGLIKEDYFETIFTTNYDLFLEDALLMSDLLTKDFIKIVNGVVKPEEVIRELAYETPRVKIIKLHGDLNAKIFAIMPEEINSFATEIERVLQEFLSEDIVIVGSRMTDRDVLRCVRKGGSIWFVNPSKPSLTESIWQDIKLRCSTPNMISGEEAQFDDFFHLLGQYLREEEAKGTKSRKMKPHCCLLTGYTHASTGPSYEPMELKSKLENDGILIDSVVCITSSESLQAAGGSVKGADITRDMPFQSFYDMRNYGQLLSVIQEIVESKLLANTVIIDITPMTKLFTLATYDVGVKHDLPMLYNTKGPYYFWINPIKG